MAYVEVAVPLPINKTFTYSVPESLAKEVGVGKRALVPFKGRRITGYVLGDGALGLDRDTKDILEVLDPTPLFSPSMVSFFQWMSEYYMCPLGQVIQSALPSGIEPTRTKSAHITSEGLKVLASMQPHDPLFEDLKWIKDNPGKALKVPYSVARRLESRGWVKVEDRVRKRRAALLTRRFVRVVKRNLSQEQMEELLSKGRARNEREFLQTVIQAGPILRRELTRLFPNAQYLIDKWVKKGLLELFDGPVLRNPLGGLDLPAPVPQKLFPQQAEVLKQIEPHLKRKEFWPALLHGVTGSGKTEVYFRAIEKALAQGRQAIFMAPEIALASYLAGLFKARFKGEIALYHSGLSEGERYEQWLRMARGEIDVVFGARSAVFAPLPNVGLIVVDEEHDTSYKQDNAPCYHGRDAAVMRGKIEGAVVLLGSGSPSIQSFYNCAVGRYRLLEMPERIEERPFPQVEVVDMKPVVESSKGGVLSPVLIQAMAQTLERGEQCILFLNRRGFYRLFLCCACGEGVRCPNCDLTLIHHKDQDRLMCHYCGFAIPLVENCPGCGHPALKAFGYGTQRLEEEVKRRFPDVAVARMDTDTVRKKGQAYAIIRRFAQKEIQVLLGTQIITKGYDFPGVTLVGVVAADLSLCFPDFRAAERTYQLLSQVAGRAGRGQRQGRVIIQTFNPEHYAIKSALGFDYRLFYEKETGLRKQLGHPPFAHLISIRLQGNHKEPTSRAAMDLAGGLKRTLASWPTRGKEITVLGPVEAPISKLRGKYRYQILVKARAPGVGQYLLREVERAKRPGSKYKGVQIIFDVDPYDML